MARTPEGPPPPAAVQRLRLRYAKRGRLRFSSHRDFQRAFERALRRAGVPMAYSAGFSPHPKISYAGAAPTGVASEAEYVEIAVTERLDPQALRVALDDSLPVGLDVLEMVEAAPGALADRLQASVWEIRLPGVDDTSAAVALEAFLAADSVQVQRLMKNGIRTFDARGAVLSALVVRSTTGSDGASERVADGGVLPCAILRVVVRHVTPAVRPDDVLAGLRQVADFAPPAPPAVCRLAQGPLDETTGTVSDPLTVDRDAVGATVRPAAQP